jgi:RND family efflux transporter MFP subunit
MSELPHVSPVTPKVPRAARRGGFILAVLAAVAVAWGLWSRVQAHAALRVEVDANNFITVTVVSPRSMGSSDELVLPASVSAWSTAPIYARTSGYVKRWLVDIGTRVKTGQLLAEIESPEVDQQLAQAQADMATDEANAKLAKVTAERWKELAKIDMVAKQDVDEKIGDADAKTAALASARANVQRLKELQGFERVLAPFDGVVTTRNADVGQLVSAGNGGQELFRVEDTQRLRVYVQVPEIYAVSIKVGDDGELRLSETSGRKFPARVSNTADALDPESRSLQVQLTVDNAGATLLPGAYAEVAFKTRMGVHALRVPANTLLIRAQGPLVATAGSDGLAHLKPVSIGRDLGTEIELVGGVDAADRIIVNPPDGIQDGERLKVAEPAPAAH